jgi:hypothetical protein
MGAWMAAPAHAAEPYPSREELRALAAAGGITPRQAGFWFGNARKRFWKVRAVLSRLNSALRTWHSYFELMYTGRVPGNPMTCARTCLRSHTSWLLAAPLLLRVAERRWHRRAPPWSLHIGTLSSYLIRLKLMTCTRLTCDNIF